MRRSHRRILIVLVALPFVVVTLAALYMEAMAELEGRPRTYTESLTWAMETLTSTGYGHDTHWNHPLMVVFVGLVQFLGVSVLFLMFPLFVMPFFEERFEGVLPRVLPKKIKDHVLVYRWSSTVSELVGQLRGAGVPVVVFEPSETTARRLMARGIDVVVGELEEEDPDPSILARARAVVVNGSDAQNGAFVLWARGAGFKGDVYAFMAVPAHRGPILTAGATAVYTPNHILAAAVAAVASERISPRIAGVKQLGDHVRADELRIGKGSPLVGKTLAESDIRRRTEATIIGFWSGGAFDPDPRPDTRLTEGSIVVALGTDDAIAALAELAHPLPVDGPFLIAGYGEVGSKVAQLLRDAGEEVVVIDKEEREGLDHVGNAMDRGALEKAGAKASRAIILALDSDSSAIFAASVARELAPDVPIIARVSRRRNVARVHQAGADFAMSTAQVAAQILGQHLLGEAAISFELRAKVVKVPAGELAGRTPTTIDVRQRTGCSVVAVERGEEVIVRFPTDFAIARDDQLYVVGSDEALSRLYKAYPGTAPAGARG